MYKFFNLNVKKIVVLLLPTFLRKEKQIIWLHALVTPLMVLHNEFMQTRKINLYRLNHNGQVCYLRGVLNNEFDKTKRRIRIIDGYQIARDYIFTSGEDQPKYLGKMFLNLRSDYADTGVDFVVEVPTEIYKETEMKALIDYCRLASKRYKIVQV